MPLQDHVLAVDGMDCGGCEQAVERALGRLEGVVETRADHASARVEVRFDADKTGPEALVERVKAAGYEVTG